jgi:DNA-binding IclR family transcriptional regulator
LRNTEPAASRGAPAGVGARSRSAYRPLRVLDLFLDGDPVTAARVAAALRVHRSTASRILHQLGRSGFLTPREGEGRWGLGRKVLDLAGAYLEEFDVRTAALPQMAALGRRTGETVNLAVLDGDSALTIEQRDGSHAVRYTTRVGRRTPLHCTATGKTLLAFVPPDVAARALRGPLARFTPRTVTDPAALRRELAAIRRRGYATNRGEWEDAVTAFAAPIRDATGVAAAVSVSGPSFRLTGKRATRLIDEMLGAADAISRELGGV